MQVPSLKRAAALAAVLGLGFSACVNAASEIDKIKDEVSKKFPQRPVKSIQATPVKGLYEVVFAPRQVVYVDAKVEYALIGDMVDIKKRVSLTEARVKELSRTDFSKLPLDLAVKVVYGNGSRKVAVFSDPDCPYCKKLESDTITKLENVTVYNFLYPLSFHPDAERKSGLIWCSSDRVKAWNDWMLEGKIGDGKPDCESPVAKTAKLAAQIGVNATPTMVFENGEIVAGAVDKDTFEAKLANKKP